LMRSRVGCFYLRLRGVVNMRRRQVVGTMCAAAIACLGIAQAGLAQEKPDPVLEALDGKVKLFLEAISMGE